jgi:hypothetical protein
VLCLLMATGALAAWPVHAVALVQGTVAVQQCGASDSRF